MILHAPWRQASVCLWTLVLLSVLAACSSSGEEDFSGPVVIRQLPITPSIYNTELVVGQNRFLLGLMAEDGALVTDAAVKLRFYDLNEGRQVMTSEAEATARVPAREAGITEVVPHKHDDGATHNHVNAGEDVGFYTAQVEFPRAGDWGVEVSLNSREPKVKDKVKLRFNVLEQGETPALGSAAPKSENRTLADVADITEIDSAASPEPGLHQTTIREAIAAGRPAVVFFGVPGYCTSRLCGPEYEILRKLYETHKDQAAFIHVEFYDKPGDPDGQPVETAREWGLRNEPWFFVIDSHGLISAKFDGPASLAELEEALLKATGG